MSAYVAGIATGMLLGAICTGSMPLILGSIGYALLAYCIRIEDTTETETSGNGS